MDLKLEVNQLRQDELVYELKIRGFTEIDNYERLSTKQVEIIYQLRESVNSTQTSLTTATEITSSLEEEKSELSLNLRKENDLRCALQKQLTEKKTKEEVLERKVCELRRNVNLLNETKKKLLDDNVMLKETLNELESALKEERDKKWWKNAADVVLESIQSAAHVMLPALPKSSEFADENH